MMASAAIIPPSVRLPVSPMNTCAGYALYHKKANACTDHGTDENRQLAQVRDVHDVEIFSKPQIAARISEYSQACTDNGARSRSKSVETISNICSVRYCGDNEYHHQLYTVSM